MTEITTTAGMQAVQPEGIPAVFKERTQWVYWKYEHRDGKPTKVPYTPGTNRRASTTDLMTWRTFSEALKDYEAGRAHGVGFVFCSGDPFVGLDFDSCRNPETGEVDPEVLEYVLGFEDRVHFEVSVSGTGFHLITRGKIRGGTKRRNRELYDQDRFFCMTGVSL